MTSPNKLKNESNEREKISISFLMSATVSKIWVKYFNIPSEGNVTSLCVQCLCENITHNAPFSFITHIFFSLSFHFFSLIPSLTPTSSFPQPPTALQRIEVPMVQRGATWRRIPIKSATPARDSTRRMFHPHRLRIREEIL